MKTSKTLMSAAIGSAFAATAALAPVVHAADNPFAATQPSSGYQLAQADGKMKDGSCGGDKKKDGSCGSSKKKDGSCGGDKKKDGSCGSDKKKDGKCGEGKCGGDKKK